MKRICFIGMPGVGKSTIGKHVANYYGIDFVDPDRLIAKQVNQSIASYIESEGAEAFSALEEDVVLNLDITKSMVVAPGGSIVYSAKAMAFLCKSFHVIYLRDEVSRILKRVGHVETRGIIGLQYGDFEALFAKRTPLYEQYAHHICYVPSSFSQLGLVCAFVDGVL